ncbi:arylsulfatase B-like [Dermacentor albipictus]|uniref:arylsulfatase B-like n=1 Tax=Dermacentor albipictus TaxID=60249 RepID=UPI0038FC487B
MTDGEDGCGAGWDDVSFHGSPQIPTPNLDALARTGVVLNNYYVMPLCSPSRGALLSGLYSIHTGFQSGILMPAQPAGLPLDVKIMPEHFKDLGYETHLVGKWHIGYYSLQYTPSFRGFDTFLGVYTGPVDYYSHVQTFLTEAELSESFSEQNAVNVKSIKMSGDGKEIETKYLILTFGSSVLPESIEARYMKLRDSRTGLDFFYNAKPLRSANGTYLTTLYTERAKYIIRNRDKSKPLFLYLAHQATHSGNVPNILQAPEVNIKKFPYIGDPNRTIYAGMLDALDQSVGAVLEALEAASMLDDTIIVFSSDNGAAPFYYALANLGSNWPLRGSKGTLWEGGVRATAFLWTPRLLRQRRVSQHLMHITDWLPTLFAAAGGNVNHLGPLDGLNMWQALNYGKASPRTEILLNIDAEQGNAALRYGKFKVLVGSLNNLDQRYQTPGESRPYRDLDVLLRRSRAAAVLRRLYGRDVFKRDDCWRRKATLRCGRVANSSFVSGRTLYLFDIDEDPCELHDLSRERPQIVSMLLEKLAAYNKTVVQPVNSTIDPEGYPENHDGVWAPWI